MNPTTKTTTTKQQTKFLRTPSKCFSETIEEFPYEPKYITNISICNDENNNHHHPDLRMAYYDIPCDIQQNPQQQQEEIVFVCLHGEPTWSYLYRHMILVLKKKGRVICFDLIGFGRSDKLIIAKDYTFTFHRNCLLKAIHDDQHLNLRNITLIVQDWGGILGLTLPMEDPKRYSRLIIMNTMLPIEPSTNQISIDVQNFYDSNKNGVIKPKTGFGKWVAYSQSCQNLDIGKLINGGCYPHRLNQQDRDAYNAPFPSAVYKVGATVFPTLVPLNPNMDGYNIGRKAIQFYQHHWNKPTFVAIGSRDNVIPLKFMKQLASYFDNSTKNISIIPDGNHFLQEHYGTQIANDAIEYFDSLDDDDAEFKKKKSSSSKEEETAAARMDMNNKKWMHQQQQLYRQSKL